METIKQDVVRLSPEVKSEQELSFYGVLDSRIVGQAAAKKAAARARRRAGNPLRNKRGPVYKALLIGKSRTGKTLTAETTALSLHGDADALVRVDCAEYQHGHEVSRLLGAPPSYVGFDAPGGNDDDQGGDKKNAKAPKAPTALLARQNLIASRKGSKTPITIILLDEIEKAHTSLKDVLLAIFDKGKIRLANNTETDFTDCIFFMTSNLGMEQLENFGRTMGFLNREPKEPTEADVAQVVNKELKQHFRPEFLKRVDETVIFAPLTQDQLDKLVAMELGFVQDRIVKGLPAEAWFEIKFAEGVHAHILAVTAKEGGGVAEVKQTIERDIIDVLAGELEKKTIAGRDLITVGFDKGLSVLTFDQEKGKGVPPMAADSTAPDKGESVTATPAKAKVPADLLELRQLIAAKLAASESERQLSQSTITFGTELSVLSRKLGGQTKDLDSVQKTFMTSEAHKLLWSKVSNAYWFWKIYQGAAKSASALPIKSSDVETSLANIRDAIGIRRVSDKYDPNKDTTVNGMRYLDAGVLLLEKGEDGNWKIRINAIFK
jgi:hypothetical protein